MSKLDLDLYFDRIHYHPTGDALEDLRQIHFHHALNIPFENLDIYFFHKDISVEPEDIFQKIVVNKRGGYCFEMNGLLFAVLKQMGYDVTPVLARLYEFGGYTPLTHRLTLIRIEGKTYIADVGFGGERFLYPLLFEEGLVQEQFGQQFRVLPHPEFGWQIQLKKGDDFEMFAGFQPHPVIHADFVMSSFFTNHHPSAPFPNHLMVNLPLEDGGRVRIFDSTFYRFNGANELLEKRVLAPEELEGVIREQFHLDVKLP